LQTQHSLGFIFIFYTGQTAIKLSSAELRPQSLCEFKGRYKRPVCTGRLYGCVRALCPYDPCTRPVQPARVHGSCGHSNLTHPSHTRTGGPYRRPVYEKSIAEQCFCTGRLYRAYRRVVWTEQPYKWAVHPTVLHSSVYLFIVKVIILPIIDIKKNYKIFWGGGLTPPQTPSPSGEGDNSTPHHTPSAPKAPRRPQPPPVKKP